MIFRAVEIGFLVLAGALAVWQLARTVGVWVRMRRDRLVLCTATGHPAAVRFDTRHAAATAFVSASPEARIADCSLWVSGGGCDQGCITEALAPESTVQRIVSRWYESKHCVYCAKPIGTGQSFGHRAALLTPQGVTREWSDVPAESVLEVLKTARPVCWNCHVAETFRREYPDMVTDRPWPKNPDRRAG